MSGPPPGRVLALAGLFQAAALVRAVAREGGCAEDALAVTLDSVLRLEAPSVEAIYGGVSGLACGLEVLRRQLASTRERDPEITRYCASLLYLERRVIGRPGPSARLRSALETLVERFGAQAETPTGEERVAALAELYLEHVARAGPRIVVEGERRHLEREANARRIRALLLGGLRSAALWRQLGGTRVGLLLQRAGYVRVAGKLLEEE